jgi:hypothetical protein
MRRSASLQLSELSTLERSAVFSQTQTRAGPGLAGKELLCPPPVGRPTARKRNAAKRRRQKQVKADAELADEVNGNGNGAA